MKTVLRGTLLVTLLGVLCCTPAQAIQVRWTWTAPTAGGPVTGYELQLQTGTGAWVSFASTTPTTVIEVPVGVSRARVRAWNLDPFGQPQYGTWSLTSTDITVQAVPGGCGTPTPGSP